MGRIRTGSLLAAVIAGPLTVLLVLREIPGAAPLFSSPMLHLAVIGAISTCALVFATLSSLAALRARQPALTILAFGCLLLSTLMLTHALTTPGLPGVPDSNLWKGRLPFLAMAGFALCLAAAGGRQHTPMKRLVGRFPRAFPIGAALVLLAAGAAIVVWPEAGIGQQAVPGEVYWLRAIALLGAAVFAVTGFVHWRRWQLGRNRVQAALFVASVLSGQSLLALAFAGPLRLPWWDYHIYIFTGLAVVAYTVVAECRDLRTTGNALATLFAKDPWDHINGDYPDVLRALVKAVEAKDGYTHGHSARVAELAVRIGQRLDLSMRALRELAQGALLHDIGKIGVPDLILNKPGKLTDEERLWVEQHPIIGWETVRDASSLSHALDPILHHHERFDGAGYPEGLAGERIPFTARITTVADVWDALTSDRAYRTAWPAEDALAHIVAGRGTHFDPRCVDALIALMADRGVHVPPDHVCTRDVEHAAEACHHAESSLSRNPVGTTRDAAR